MAATFTQESGKFKKIPLFHKKQKRDSDRKSRSLERPSISQPTLISSSSEFGAPLLYESIDELCQPQKRDQQGLPAMPRTSSTGSESYTRFIIRGGPHLRGPPAEPAAGPKRRRPPSPPKLRRCHSPPEGGFLRASSNSRNRTTSRHSYEPPTDWNPSFYAALNVPAGRAYRSIPMDTTLCMCNVVSFSRCTYQHV